MTWVCRDSNFFKQSTFLYRDSIVLQSPISVKMLSKNHILFKSSHTLFETKRNVLADHLGKILTIVCFWVI